MSEENINSQDPQETPSWEAQLQIRANEVINQQIGQQVSQRIGSLKSEIERLQSTIAELSSKLDEQAQPVAAEPETSGLLDYVKQWFSDSSAKAEQDFQAKLEQARAESEQAIEQRLAQARSEWETSNQEVQEAEFQKRLEQACTEAAAVARREADARIEELQEQLEGSRQALTLAVSSAQSATAQAAGFDHLKSAIEDIDAQRTQSDTLTTLVRRAAQFAPRVVFFVVKGDAAIGWKATGFENGLNDETVRLLSVPTQNQSLLREALTTFTTSVGRSSSPGDNSAVLGLYGSPAPETTIAVPLVVRGKAAAVLYADSGTQSENSINAAALESLLRVASMGIELLPARRGVESVRPVGPPPQLNPPAVAATAAATVVSAPEQAPTVSAEPEKPVEPEVPSAEAQAAETQAAEAQAAEAQVSEAQEVQDDFADSARAEEPEVPDRITEELSKEAAVAASEVTERFSAPTQFEPEPAPITEVPTAEVPVVTSAMVESAREELKSGPLPPPPPAPPLYSAPNNVAPKIEAPVSLPAEPIFTAPAFTPPSPVFTSPSPEPPRPAQPVMSVPTPTSETEQRAHNDARRFARLLVSEIKLYNAAKVNEGRRSLDLYDRLKDEIDRSRKVYDKRVSPAVATRFDYFYDELVQTLAEGDTNKLGPNCPGPVVIGS
ncbi:MAG TPA: hypothetical protein VGB07_03250 [Blastocatellia bacterium]